MPESKTPRPFAEIQQQFNQLCFQAGQLQYQIFCLTKDLGLLNDNLRDINVEAAASQAAEKAAKAAAETASTPSPATPVSSVVPATTE